MLTLLATSPLNVFRIWDNLENLIRVRDIGPLLFILLLALWILIETNRRHRRICEECDKAREEVESRQAALNGKAHEEREGNFRVYI